MRTNTFLQPDGFYLSASRINLYNQCKRCFYLKYVLGVPMPYEDNSPYRYGTAVHNTVDAISQGAEYNVSKEDFNSEDDYNSYLGHKKLIENTFVQGGGNGYFVPEVEFVSTMGGMPVYGFLDGLVFDDKFKEEIGKYGFVPRAVEKQADGLGLIWYGYNKDLEKQVITSELGQFGESKIIKMVEMKTQANKRSYNAIKTNYQFILYSMIAGKFFNSPLFQLVNFYRKPTPGIQKERIVFNSNQEGMLLDKVLEIIQRYNDSDWNVESTCGHYSQYGEVCKNFGF